MKIVKRKTGIGELRKMAENMFGDMVKAVVDVEKRIMAVDGELHSDEEAVLIEAGYRVNLYPYEAGDSFIEFDSMINLKPSMGNRTRDVDNLETRKRIIDIIDDLIEK